MRLYLIVVIAWGCLQLPQGAEKPSACSHSSEFTRHDPPRTRTTKSRSSLRTRSPAHSVYNPPSPAESCSGTVASVKMKAATPRKQLFVAMAAEEHPGFASTVYARVLEQIQLYGGGDIFSQNGLG